MIVVNARTRALVIVSGVMAAVGAFALFGTAPAGMVAFGTLWFAAASPGADDSIAVDLRGARVDPRDVRRYREDHPGTTIIEAASAIARR